MLSHTEIELAYAAGLFDGEGHICISYTSGNPKSYKGKYPRYQMRVQVGQSTKEAIEWLHQKFGGSIVRKRQSKRAYDNVIYYRWDWTLSTEGAANFLRLIMPYLLLKGDEAKIALDFQKTMSNSNREKVPSNVVEFRKNCFEKIRELRRKKYAIG